jgi:hypothetical protein
VNVCAILPADASQATIQSRAAYSAGSDLRLVCMHLTLPCVKSVTLCAFLTTISDHLLEAVLSNQQPRDVWFDPELW